MKSRKRKLIEGILLKDYDKYYRMAVSFVHSEGDAMDIVQTGALRAIDRCGTLRDEKFASTWIYRIMVNEVYRFLGRSKESPLDEIEEQEMEESYGEIELRQALERLPLRDKVILELRYFEEMKLEEIAKITEEPISTVKSRLYRSLKKLRLSFEQED